jgi:hypothetical protein
MSDDILRGIGKGIGYVFVAGIALASIWFLAMIAKALVRVVLE